MKNLLLLLLACLAFNVGAQTVKQLNGQFSVAAVDNDTLIELKNSPDQTFTGNSGYFDIEYTPLVATDGVITFGSVDVVNGIKVFYPMSEPIVLSNSTALTKINGVNVYLFTTVEGVTTWKVKIYFTYFTGDCPAFLYQKVSPDNGYFTYRFKSVTQ